MARVYLGLGSNIDAETNLRLAVRELKRRFGGIDVSPVYRSPPLGFEGDDFLNAVVGLDTPLSPDDILTLLEEVHVAAGRRRDTKLVSRTLDIDLLLYDGLVLDHPGLHLPRSDVLRYNFVLKPLAELAPDFVHPLTGKNMAEHWRHFEANCGENGAPEWHPLTECRIDLGADAP